LEFGSSGIERVYENAKNFFKSEHAQWTKDLKDFEFDLMLTSPVPSD